MGKLLLVWKYREKAFTSGGRAIRVNKAKSAMVEDKRFLVSEVLV